MKQSQDKGAFRVIAIRDAATTGMRENTSMGFKRAKSAKDAEWVETALGEGDFYRVSGVVPMRFEAYAAVLYPAWKCVCSENKVNPEYAERPGEPIRWADVADARIPVVYGRTYHSRFGRLWSNPTQYRRLEDGNWIVDELVGVHDVTPLLRAGDEWIAGPMEDTPGLEKVSFLKNVLSAVTPAAESCWFGIWEGYGWSPEVLNGAVSICIHSDRPWLLYRAPLSELTTSVNTIDPSRGASGSAYVVLQPDNLPGPDVLKQRHKLSASDEDPPAYAAELAPPDIDDNGISFRPANMAWPEDRSWFMARGIDLFCTYIAGSRELIERILDAPDVEARVVQPNDKHPTLKDVLQPLIEKPREISLPPAFEARTAPADWTIQKGRIRWETRSFPKDIVNWIKWRRQIGLAQRKVFRMTGIRRLGLAGRIAVWLKQRRRKV